MFAIRLVSSCSEMIFIYFLTKTEKIKIRHFSIAKYAIIEFCLDPINLNSLPDSFCTCVCMSVCAKTNDHLLLFFICLSTIGQ